MTLAAWFAAHPEIESGWDAIAGFRCARDVSALAARPGACRPRAYVTSSATYVYPMEKNTTNARFPPDRLAADRARVAELLHELFPEASVLIVTRGFRDALLSTYSEHARMGGSAPIAELFAGAGEYLNYDHVLELYENEFGSERLVVLPYELLRDDPERFSSEIEGHLGVSGGGTLPRRNRAVSPAALYWYPKLSKGVTWVLARAGERARRRLLPVYVNLIEKDALARPAGLLGRLAPGRRVTAADVPNDVLETFRGRAERLRGRAFYEPYQADYLNEK
jgi:hypothetical protein